MAPLLRTNPYLQSPVQRERMLIRNAISSSVYEGARGLRVGCKLRALRAKASAKKRVSKS